MDVDTLISSLNDLEDDESRLIWLRKNNAILNQKIVQGLKTQIEEIGYGGELENSLQLVDYAFLVVSILEDALAEALIWRAWANILQVHEQYEDSLEISNRAVSIYEKHGTFFEVAVARTVQVGVLGALERFDEAISLAFWIRPHFEEADFKLGEGRLAGALARVYAAAWRLEEALPEYERAYNLYQQLNRDLDAAWVKHNMGSLAMRMDRLDMAWHYFSEAYPIFVSAEDTVSMIKTQFNMARVRWRQAQYEAAKQHLGQARVHLDELDELKKENKGLPDKGYVDLLEARVLRELHQPQEAESLLRQALRLFDSLERHLEAAETLVELSQLLISGTDSKSLTNGLHLLEQAEAHLNHLDVPLFKAWIHLKKGEILYNLGNTEAAAKWAQAAASVFRKAGLYLRLEQAQILFADCIWKQQPEVARQCYQSALTTVGENAVLIAVRSWHGLGRLSLAEGDMMGAETAYTRAVSILEELRLSLYSHQHKAGFLEDEDKQKIFEGLLQALHKQANREIDILGWVERFKAAALADLLIDQPQDQLLDETLSQLLTEREEITILLDKRLSSQNSESHDMLAYASRRGPALAAYNNILQAEDIPLLRRKLQLLDERISQGQDPTNAWRDGSTIEPTQIYQLLDENTVLVAYYALNDQLYALSVTNSFGDLQIHRLPTTLSNIKNKWYRAHKRIVDKDSSLKKVQQSLFVLHNMLVEPLLDRFNGKTHLIILPHRDLLKIPFAALYNTRQQQYMIEKWTLQIAPNATILALCQKRVNNAAGSLLTGYPGKLDNKDYLRGVKRELDALNKIVPNPTMLYGDDATKESVLKNMLHKRIVHLAGHAFYTSEHPLESGIPLADDRWLRASDLYIRNNYLDGSLVVLGGCRTGLGQLKGGDVLGLTSAFLYAGATAIIASLWEVDDEATVSLMEAFYRELLQSNQTAEALRLAQLHLLGMPQYSLPFYWAPFSLSGDSRILFP